MVKEFLMVIEKNRTQHHKALVSVYPIVSVFPKNSETLHWRLLGDLSRRERWCGGLSWLWRIFPSIWSIWNWEDWNQNWEEIIFFFQLTLIISNQNLRITHNKIILFGKIKFWCKKFFLTKMKNGKETEILCFLCKKK